jgi:hypothetical protein
MGVHKLGLRVLWGVRGSGVAQLRRVWIVMRLPLNCAWSRDQVRGQGNSMGLILEARSSCVYDFWVCSLWESGSSGTDDASSVVGLQMPSQMGQTQACRVRERSSDDLSIIESST